MLLGLVWAATALGQDLPFLGIWTNTVFQGRVTVNVSTEYRSNGVVIVSSSAAPYRSGIRSYTGRYEVVGTDIIFYGQSGQGFGFPNVDRHETTNVMIYNTERDMLFNKSDTTFQHPMQRQNTVTNNQAPRK